MSEPQAAAPEPKPLSLHVPEPEFRPGDKPDFSNVPIPKAGAARMPPVDVEAQEIHDLAYTIIRVMDREGNAVGPWADLLSDEQVKEGLEDMLRVRAFAACAKTIGPAIGNVCGPASAPPGVARGGGSDAA